MGGEVVIWRISRCLDSNICWNSGRKYSNGGFVALARPTQRAASVRGKRGKIFCFENLNFYSWNDYFKHRAHGLGWLVCSQFVFPKLFGLGGFASSLVHPTHTLGKIFRRGFRGFGLIMHISSFFSNCLGAAPTFDVDFNIYCSLALGRRFANPQFEDLRRARPSWGLGL